VFSKNGGNMAEQGAVAWMFERKSQIFVSGEKTSEDQLMGIVLDAGADDLRQDGDQWEVLSRPEAHEAVLKALEGNGLKPEDASIAMVPKNLVKLEGKNAGAMLRLNEALEDHEDVQNVYSNFDIDEKELEALA
jgi:transcriptional/translational regulatory protein YebC/TACO1